MGTYFLATIGDRYLATSGYFFMAIAHAESGRHSWQIEISCVVDGVRFVLVGKPDSGNFVTVGRVGLKGFFWVTDEELDHQRSGPTSRAMRGLPRRGKHYYRGNVCWPRRAVASTPSRHGDVVARTYSR